MQIDQLLNPVLPPIIMPPQPLLPPLRELLHVEIVDAVHKVAQSPKKPDYHGSCEHQKQTHQCRECAHDRLQARLGEKRPREPFEEQDIVSGGYWCYWCCMLKLDGKGGGVVPKNTCNKHTVKDEKCKVHKKRITDCFKCKDAMKAAFGTPGADYHPGMGAAYCNKCGLKKGTPCKRQH